MATLEGQGRSTKPLNTIISTAKYFTTLQVSGYFEARSDYSWINETQQQCGPIRIAIAKQEKPGIKGLTKLIPAQGYKVY